MVRPGVRRGDDDLGPMTDRTGRVEGHAVITSSRRSSTQPPTIPFRTRPPTTSHYPYAPVPYNPYGYSQPPQTSYDPYAHAPSLPIRMSIPVYSSYSGPDCGATNCGNPSFDAGLGRDSGTFRSEEAVRVASLCIHSGEDDEDEHEDDGGHDDDDGDSDGDDDEPVPVAQASSSGHRPAPGKGKRLTGSSMSVMSKISRPLTNPMQRKKAKNDG
ncbi:hypothetical protein M9H77_19266 [Catharanthus roseus]|uniref:Uncharacterized protein n=1 Tax=Catharanthus roseus TaxID=4058 RepID=A0ACC0BA41_CATRO|nr:hypothetical protein M9H77_19266 [Catharanthus roseus]